MQEKNQARIIGVRIGRVGVLPRPVGTAAGGSGR
jgi:hypothetical protein